MTLIELFNAALNDPVLAALLLADPAAALDSQGIEVTDGKIQALQTVIDAILTASFVFDGTIKVQMG